MRDTSSRDPFSQWLQRSPRIQALLVILCLGWFAALAAWQARTNTPTVDEFVQVPIGLYHLKTQAFDIDRRNPPLMKILSAAPLIPLGASLDPDVRWRGKGEGWWMWTFGTRFMRVNAERYFDLFFAARAVNIAAGLALGLCVYLWARSWLGPGGGLITLYLYSTFPLLLGHSSVATLDIGVSFFIFAGFQALRRLARDPKRRWAALAGLLLGCALASKFITMFFLPFAPLLLALEWKSWRPGNRLPFLRAISYMAMAGWLVINAAYCFKGFPLPPEMLDGIVLKTLERSENKSLSFLLGVWSTKGWWYYYAVALFYKSTAVFLLLLAAAVVAFLNRRRELPAFGFTRLETLLPVLWIALPPAALLYVLSFHYRISFGVRYILPAFPFLILIAGYGAQALLASGRGERIALILLLAWQWMACAANAPHHLAYFNETAGGPHYARHILLDSNLDWGQDLGRLKAYLDRENPGKIRLGYFGSVDPKLYGIDYTLPSTEPQPGFYAVSANYLAGFPLSFTYIEDGKVYEFAGTYSWLEEHKPVARVGHSIYVFRITPEDIRQTK